MPDPLIVTPLLRAHSPAFARLCDRYNELNGLFEVQSKLVANLTTQRDALADAVVELRAENESLKALLKAKGGAA